LACGVARRQLASAALPPRWRTVRPQCPQVVATTLRAAARDERARRGVCTRTLRKQRHAQRLSPRGHAARGMTTARACR
jgi:hypothetical protein